MGKTYPMTLKKEEVDKILAEAEKRNEFDYMLLLTLKNTGRRIGELYGIQKKKLTGYAPTGQTRQLYSYGKPITVDKTIPVYKKLPEWRFGVTVKDIDFEKGVMKVVVLKRKKYVYDETILTPENVRIIRSYVRKNGLRLDDYVFRKKGRKLRAIENIMKRYAKKAGIPTRIKRDGTEYSLSLHSLRHNLVTELKRQGWSDDMIIKITGHKSTETLRSYDHIVATDIKNKFLEAVDKI